MSSVDSKIAHHPEMPEGTSKRSVFISHASKNFPLADEVRQLLEEKGWKCWIAPRDIPASRSYGEEISVGIASCSITLLLLTDVANASEMVAKEIALSIQFQKPIIPLRLQDITPSDKLRYFLANCQWVDAFETPLKQRIEEVINIVRAVESKIPPPPPTPEKKTVLGSIERQLERVLRYKLIAAICVIIVFGGLGVSIYGAAHRADAAVALEKSTIEKDPSTLGLVKLTSNPSIEDSAKPDIIDIWAAVYLNAKGTSFAKVKLTAVIWADSSSATTMDLSPMVVKAGALDAQTFTFSVPKKSNHVQVCMTAIHPTLKERYTAIWSYRIEQVGDTVNLTKDRAAWMERANSKSCSAEVESPKV